MHICFAALDYPTKDGGGGVGSYVQTLAHNLIGQGHQVSVLVLDPRNEHLKFDDQGVQLLKVRPGDLHWYFSRIPVLRLLSDAVRELEYSWAVWKTFQELHVTKPCDVIEGSETGMLFLCLLKRWHRCRVIVRLHGEKWTIYLHRPGRRPGLGLWLQRRLQLLAIGRADRLTSPSTRHAVCVRNEIRRELPISVLPGFLNDREIELAAAEYPWPPELANLEGRPFVFFAGRIERGKGVEPLLRAAAMVIRTVPEAHFVFAGGTHPAFPLSEREALVRELAVNDRVHFVGMVPREQLWAFYRVATVVAMPSYYETFGNTFIEGMAAGRPVVGFADTSLEEILGDSGGGITVPKGVITELSRQLTNLLLHPQAAAAMGMRGRRHVLENFTDRLMLPRFLAFYRSILSSYPH